MTNYVVSAGQTSTGIVLNNGDTETVLSGGTANGTAVNSGGVLNVSGGTASGTTVAGGGTATVLSGGTALATTLTGGDFYTSSGGTTSGLVVGSGGTEHEYLGAAISGVQVLAGGSIAAEPRFGGGDDRADINPQTDLLTDQRYFGTTKGPAFTETLVGDYNNLYFHVTTAASGGDVLTLSSVPCYCRGTMILTDDGERAVEDLAIGDRVATPDGAMPVRWIGRRGYSGRFARGNKTVLPIRVAAGAFADGVPSRDLFVSPKHALLLDGVLVPAEALVNGVSVTQTRDVESVEYFHVELDRHAILIADGAEAESFVDDDSRGVFHNAREHAARYPDARPTAAVYCAPRHEDGERVEAIRRRLARRAEPAAAHADFGPLRGSVDSFGGERLYGWAQHAARPDMPVCLEVALGDVVVARVLANRYRDDLRRGGLGSGRHAFEVPLSRQVRADLQAHGAHALRVRRIADGAELAPSMPGSRDVAA